MANLGECFTCESCGAPLPGGMARRGRGELSQSRSAVWSAVALILFVDVLYVVLWMTSLVSLDGKAIVPMAIDLLLGIALLRGRRGARIWMLIRVVLGLVVFGIMWGIQGDYSSVAMQAGYSLAIIVLLTGSGTRARIASGVTVFVVGAVASVVMVAAPSSVARQEVLASGEPDIPSHFSTYTEEAVFSISVPAEWSVAPDVIVAEWAEARAESLTSGGDSAAVEYLFLAGVMSSDGYYPAVSVVRYPRTLLAWTLDAVVKGESQWERENMQGYREHSQVRTLVGGKDAILVNWEEEEPGWGTWQYLELYTLDGGVVWKVTCSSEKGDFGEYAGDFNSVVRSLRILR